MASQISHIVYAKKYLEKYPFSIANKDEFLLGCVFPDIRRLAENLTRKGTHRAFDPVDLDFRGLSSFRAGWKFHIYCDMRREEILNSYGFYELTNDNGKFWQANKMLEDELLYDVYNNWEKLVHYFNHAPAVELPKGLSRQSFDLWYAIVAKYIEEKPSDKSMRIFLSKQLLFKNADVIMERVDRLRKNKEVTGILRKVMEDIV
ncbi:MAG: hypothetical protein Q8L10_04785 [Candidatus Moranbacteria bacterium]|nr:hypothetical protein [Candidatus Moranbacteria bacterium]